MDEEPAVPETVADTHGDAAGAAAGEAEADCELAPPIESRFLYVDVAAQRAKQLRRGALPRLEELVGAAEADGQKLERIAMREVDRRKIHYDVPVTARGE